MSSPEELKLDLEFYDSLYSALRQEFYKDQTKYKNDAQVTSEIKKIRTLIQENYKRAQLLASAVEPFPIRKGPHITPTGFTTSDSFEYLYDISLKPSEFVKKHHEFKISDGGIILPRGTYTFHENIIFPQNTRVTIHPGTRIYLSGGVSLISYSPIKAIGNAGNPIVIGRENTGRNWGSIAVINVKEKSEFRYVTMIGGSSSERINGVTFTGMLSAHNAPLYVFNSQFYNDNDDDIINVKYSTGEIGSSQFFDSAGDAIDLDMTENFRVQNNTFSNIGLGSKEGDAIDMSFSNAYIANNTITGCGDKGISVGEKSTPVIEFNTISGCAIGIAIKDQSKALIIGNKIMGNDEGISLYQKKPIFGGGEAVLENNTLIRNNTNVVKDEFSKIEYRGIH